MSLLHLQDLIPVFFFSRDVGFQGLGFRNRGFRCLFVLGFGLRAEGRIASSVVVLPLHHLEAEGV